MATITIRAGAGVAKIDLRQSNGVTATIYENDQYSWTRLDRNSWISVEDVDALPSYSNPYTDNYGNNLNNGHTYYFSGGDQNVYVKATYKQPVATYTIKIKPSISVPSFSWRMSDGGSGTWSLQNDGPEASWTRAEGTELTITSCAPSSSYKHPVYYERTDQYQQQVTKSDGTWNDPIISFTANKTGTLVATYSQPTPTYTLSYDGNGADEGSMQPQTGSSSYYVEPCNFDKDFCLFDHWETAGGKRYDVGDIITLDADTTLYAKWVPEKTITVTLISKGTPYQTRTEGAGLSFTLPTIADTTTEAFEHWYEIGDGGEYYIYDGGESVYFLDDTTLYAAWETIGWNITYDFNGGQNGPENGIKKKDVAYTIPSKTPTKFGYTFAGWDDRAGKAWKPGESYIKNAGVTFYAIWTANTYTITYNLNGGGGGPTSPDTKTHGVTYTIPSTKPTKTGNTFQHWVDDLDNPYDPGESYYRNANTTFSAVWKLREYDVTYYANGGSGAPDKQTKVYGVNLTLSSTRPTRTGHTFQGWAKSSSATTAQYQPGATYTENQTLYLWAVWKANEYNVKYNANGGENPPEDQKKVYGVDLTLSTVKPTKTDSVFVGWGLSSTATTATYQPGDTYTTNAGIVLYAVWTAKTKFYWHGSNAEDAKYFKVGARIDLAVTASAWNELCDYINTVRSLAGLSTVAFAKVEAGKPIKANTFNIVRNAINQIVTAGYGSSAYVPDTVSTGTTIKTVMFNGTKGLKNAINKCMDDL